MEVHLWADKHFDIPADLKAQIKEVKKDKDGFIKTMTKQFQKQPDK